MEKEIGGAGAGPLWRGVIEHVRSGWQLSLEGFDESTAFIESYLPGINEIHEGTNRTRMMK